MFKNDTYQIELIEAYLAGTMTASERDKFEARMAKDKQLRQDVLLHRITIAGLRYHGRSADKALGKAMQGLTRDELKALLQRQREQRLDVAACKAEPSSDTESTAPLSPLELF